MSCKIAANDWVLLQVGDFIISCPVLQLGVILWMKIRTYARLCSSTETVADSELQPKFQRPAPACSNTFVVRSLLFQFFIFLCQNTF